MSTSETSPTTGEEDQVAEATSSTNPLYDTAAGAPPGGLAPVAAELAEVPEGCLLDAFGMRLTHVGAGRSRVEMTVGPIHLNQRGLPQGGALVALADAAAGFASYGALSAGRFTTLQLTCNLLGRASEGTDLVALASPVHLGRQTLVLDVDVFAAEQEEAVPRRLVARFSCTQLVLG